MFTFEDRKLTELLSNDTIIEQLNHQLNEIIPVSNLNYQVGFISSDYFSVDKDLNSFEVTPPKKELIQGNPKTAEVYLTPEIITVSKILRPTEVAIAKYLMILNSIKVFKVCIKPFFNMQNNILELYQKIDGGGCLIRIGEVKEYNLPKS